MPLLVSSAKLAAYLACVTLALRHVHKLGWRLNGSIPSLAVSTFAKSLLSTFAAVLPLFTALLVTLIFAALDGQPFDVIGLSYSRDAITFTGSGAAVGFTCVLLMYICGYVMGFIRIKKPKTLREPGAHIPMFVGGLTDYFAAAVFEEIITRGYIFFVLNQAFGAVTAIIGSSLVFSLAHLIKRDDVPLIFTVNAFIFGLLTGIWRWYTGTLWLPIGLHFGWNVTAGPILGLPYSGVSYDRGMVVSEVSGPQWFTGGFYSPDAGVLGTVALIVAALSLRLITPII